MPSLDLLDDDELSLLDGAIRAVPPSQLRDRCGLLLLRQGMRPDDICRLQRRGFSAPEREFPGQVKSSSGGLEEVTILPKAASDAVQAMLYSHDAHLILPGMTVDRLVDLLAARLKAAQVRPVSWWTLRNTVRQHALVGDGS